jgi:hypothetical protein
MNKNEYDYEEEPYNENPDVYAYIVGDKWFLSLEEALEFVKVTQVGRYNTPCELEKLQGEMIIEKDVS